MLVFRNILRTYKWKNLNFSPLFMKNRLKRCYSQVYFEPCKISMTEVLLAKANGSIINVEKVPNMSLSVLSRVKLGQYPVATSPHKHKLGRIRFGDNSSACVSHMWVFQLQVFQCYLIVFSLR